MLLGKCFNFLFIHFKMLSFSSQWFQSAQSFLDRISSRIAAKLSEIGQEAAFFSDNLAGKLCKSLAISGLILYVFYILLSNHPCCQSSNFFVNLRQKWGADSPTNLSDLVFGIAASVNTWRTKRIYVDSWWRPNITRGYLFLERTPTDFLPWPSSFPPFRVSEDITRYQPYNKHRMPHAIRMVRVIAETFREENKGVRWYVMADDDTVLFVDNLVEVLAGYDHRKYFYIGMNSECVTSNIDHSFEMAFGGAGYALSYPLAEALARNLDVCIKRYPTLYGSDHILQSCVADLGVSLTQEKGFHQIDLHGDLSGLLSAHPQSPFLSLHHLDVTDPLFPSMNRNESVVRLMEAANVDHSRLLQQTICYHKPYNWSFSISWGYTAHIYESLYPPSILERPLQTFVPWKRIRMPPYMFNTRFPSKTPCEAPHVFFFESAEEIGGEQIVTTYARKFPRLLQPCSSSGNHSADHISKVRVFSPLTRLYGTGNRRECCDIVRIATMDVSEVKYRACLKDEIVG